MYTPNTNENACAFASTYTVHTVTQNNVRYDLFYLAFSIIHFFSYRWHTHTNKYSMLLIHHHWRAHRKSFDLKLEQTNKQMNQLTNFTFYLSQNCAALLQLFAYDNFKYLLIVSISTCQFGSIFVIRRSIAF